MGQIVSFSTEMAICIVIFNPAKSKKIIQNYYTMMSYLKEYPVYVLELLYADAKPEIRPQKRVYHAYTNSVMFHKENLCRVLETHHIPSKYKKIAFVDADLIWDVESDWYEKAKAALDTHDVVQLFDSCQWLDPWGYPEMRRQSVIKMKSETYDSGFHPGFAWAFRRDWYRKVGFFDYAVTGSGDTLSAIKWLDKKIPHNFKSVPAPMTNAYAEFCAKPQPRITCLRDVEVSHLYHGSRKNRKYVERHALLDTNIDIRKLLYTNRWGVYEWTDTKWSTILQYYFISRGDDDVDEENENPFTSLDQAQTQATS